MSCLLFHAKAFITIKYFLRPIIILSASLIARKKTGTKNKKIKKDRYEK